MLLGVGVLWGDFFFIEKADTESDEGCCEHDGANECKIDYGVGFCHFRRKDREEKSGREKYRSVLLSILKWKAPLSLVRRTRWRFVVAILVGLAETAGWVVGVAYLLTRRGAGGG